MIPKPIRETDPDYIKYLKRQRCAYADHNCIGDIVAEHTKTRGSGGSDYWAVPSCYFHHELKNHLGVKTFQERMNVDFRDLRIKYLIGYIKELKRLEND